MDTQLFIDTQWLGTIQEWKSMRERYAPDRGAPLYHLFLQDNWPRENVRLPFPASVDEYLTAHHQQRSRGIMFFEEREAARRERALQFEMKVQRNLAPKQHSRLGILRKWSYREVRELVHDFQRFHPENPAAESPDYEELLEDLNTLRERAPDLAARLAELFSSVQFCSNCDALFHENDGAYSLSTSGTICPACQDDHYYSECQDGYIHCDDACSVFHSVRAANRGDADDYCTESYGNRNFAEYDGRFFTDEDDCDDFRREQEEYECDDDDDGSNARGYSPFLRDYHCSMRHFVEDIRGPFPPIGVELEVYAPDRSDAVKALREVYPEHQLLLERDGSLDNACGFEIITMPLGLTGWQELAPKLLQILKEKQVVGFNEPAGPNYGIHVSIHRRFLSSLAEARIAMFLVAQENHDFVKAIAQRNSIYASNNELNLGKIKSPKVLSICSHLENIALHGKISRKPCGYTRYAPLNFRESLAEFRIFQSTTNPASFMKNLEFVWALQRWTLSEAGTGRSIDHRDFIKWLVSPQHRNDFPNLITFLSKKKFFGTNYQPISSSWQELMLKPVETDAIEPMAA